MTVDFLKKNWRSALGYIAIMSAASSGGNATSPSKTSSSWRRHSQSRRGICSLTFHDQMEKRTAWEYQTSRHGPNEKTEVA